MRSVASAFVLLAASAGMALACPESFRQLETVSPATSPRLATADGTAVAWSIAAADLARNLVTSQLIVREGDRERTIFETHASPRNQVLGPDGAELDANYDVFCLVDWSSDGRYLLAHEVVGAWRSNAIDDLYWIWDRPGGRRQLLDVVPLMRAVARHWMKRGASVEDGEYTVEPLGWQVSNPARVVLAASTIFTPEDRFLGLWSVGLRGEDPRLLTARPNPELIRRWGRAAAQRERRGPD